MKINLKDAAYLHVKTFADINQNAIAPMQSPIMSAEFGLPSCPRPAALDTAAGEAAWRRGCPAKAPAVGAEGNGS